MARGNGRRRIFLDDRDRRHFEELLGDLRERFGILVQAWALMDNHYHLLVVTPEANLSRGCQWLNVSYSVWFHRRHESDGHFFQGRFKSLVVEEGRSLEVARYVHLNPIRLEVLGLGKDDRRRQRTAAAADPGEDLVGQRLRHLREFPWSSYRAYVGLAKAPKWLDMDGLLGPSGISADATGRRKLREYHEAPLREGRLESVWECAVGGAIFGSAEFVASIRARLKSISKEVPRSTEIVTPVSWERIVAAVEVRHGGKWDEFRDRHGDWGRDVAAYFGRRAGRMTLAQLGERLGGVGVAAIGQAVSRVGKWQRERPEIAEHIRAIQRQLSKLKI